MSGSVAIGTAAAARPGFNLSLNGYRGLCALLVFVFHLGSAKVIGWPGGTPGRDALAYAWSSLSYGVEMFFMISGFVILGSLLRHPTVGGFLRDRCVRIFSAWVPALLAVTAICVALDLKVFAGLNALEAAGLFLANLFLLPPIVPLPLVHIGSWSLTYEWVFYLTAAAGALLVRRTVPAPVWTGVWMAVAALFIVLFPCTLFFLTGVIVFRWQSWFREHRQWLRLPVASLLVFLLAWRATGADAAQVDDTLLHWVLDGRWVFAVIAFLASLHLFASVCLGIGPEFAFLTGRTFQFLGNISYSFYLWHVLVMAAVKRVVSAFVVPFAGTEAGFLVFALGSGVVGVGVSWLSWQLFETALARRVRRRITAPELSLRSAHAT